MKVSTVELNSFLTQLKLVKSVLFTLSFNVNLYYLNITSVNLVKQKLYFP